MAPAAPISTGTGTIRSVALALVVNISERLPPRALEGLTDGRLDIIRRLNPRKTTRFMRLGVGKVVKSWFGFLMRYSNSPFMYVPARRIARSTVLDSLTNLELVGHSC
jgi:hypothetical protein